MGLKLEKNSKHSKTFTFKELRFYKWKADHKHVNTCHRVIMSDNDKEGSVMGVGQASILGKRKA